MPTPALLDKDNLDSQIGPEDLTGPERENTPKEDEIVALVNKRYQAAANARRPHDPKLFLSLAFYLGEQNLGWSTNSRKLIDTRNLAQDWKSYTVRNLIKGKILTLLGQATQTTPTAIASPKTSSALDQEAASEARALLAHFDQLHDRGQQTSEALLWALTTSTACLKIYWDPTAEADVPEIDDNGNVTGSGRAEVGEICEDIVPIFDLYFDPAAKHWDRLAWIIHEQVRDLSYVQERYGGENKDGPGWRVKGQTGSGTDGYIESRMNSIVGDLQPGGAGSTDVCTVRELWEKPSARYPKGRLIVTAADVVLRYEEEWPCEKTDTFPFVPLAYLKGLGSIYGLNAVWDCIGAQRTYNTAIRAMEEYLANPWGKWYAPRGAEIDPDALNDPREIVYFNTGFQPSYQAPPQLADIVPKSIEVADANLNDLSGVRSVSEGDAPPGVTAASAIQQLTAANATQLKQCLTNIETFHKQRAEWEIALASQFYAEPRLIGVQDTVDQQGAAQEYTAFKALTQGGSCRITVAPGSAIPQSPQAKQQQMAELFKMLLSQGPPTPDMVSIFITMLKAMEIEESDSVVEELETLLEQMQQEKAQAAAQAQAQQEAQQAQQQATQAQQAQQAQSQQQSQMLGKLLDQQHAVGMQQNELGGHLAKMAATHALGQHDKAQEMATQQAAPQGQEPQSQPSPIGDTQGDSL